MSDTNEYLSYKIPKREQVESENNSVITDKQADMSISFDNQPYAEIEIVNDVDITLKPVPVPIPPKPIMDEKRKIFNSMREISKHNHSSYFMNSKFYMKQAQYENSKIFYKQAVFMKDFEDDYSETIDFSSYFPYYQMMSYAQLRTYFTWRTKVRNGIIEKISLSYVFVYIYELINNIGVIDPTDGLEKLITFLTAYKTFDNTIEKYILKWLKDYHIYYELSKSFKEFIIENKLEEHYPDIVRHESEMIFSFDRFLGISKYNIQKSNFYSDKTKGLITECFDFVINQIKDILEDAEISLENLIFQPSKCKTIWTPFSGALFYKTIKQTDRQVVLSDDEIYICSNNQWFLCRVITLESGRQLIGYVFKQMEAVLRKITKYKYKLSANLNMLSKDITEKFEYVGIDIEKTITDAVLEFYREKNKTVVNVNPSILNKIRIEALSTQEKLIVPEPEEQISPIKFEKQIDTAQNVSQDATTIESDSNSESVSDEWISLKKALTTVEIKALSVILEKNTELKKFADESSVMVEVLVDSINEKSMDFIGDNLIDEEFVLYNDYEDKIKELVGWVW